MRRFHYYHKDTGVVHPQTIAMNVPGYLVRRCVMKNCPPGHAYIEAELHPDLHRVDPNTRKIIQLSEKIS